MKDWLLVVWYHTLVILEWVLRIAVVVIVLALIFFAFYEGTECAQVPECLEIVDKVKDYGGG